MLLYGTSGSAITAREVWQRLYIFMFEWTGKSIPSFPLKELAPGVQVRSQSWPCSSSRMECNRGPKWKENFLVRWIPTNIYFQGKKTLQRLSNTIATAQYKEHVFIVSLTSLSYRMTPLKILHCMLGLTCLRSWHVPLSITLNDAYVGKPKPTTEEMNFNECFLASRI